MARSIFPIPIATSRRCISSSMSGNKGNAEHAPLLVIASGVFRWLGLHMSHEPDERSVKLLVRKGRKKRKGKAPRKSGTRCRSTILRWDETEKRDCSAGKIGRTHS